MIFYRKKISNFLTPLYKVHKFSTGNGKACKPLEQFNDFLIDKGSIKGMDINQLLSLCKILKMDNNLIDPAMLNRIEQKFEKIVKLRTCNDENSGDLGKLMSVILELNRDVAHEEFYNLCLRLIKAESIKIEEETDIITVFKKFSKWEKLTMVNWKILEDYLLKEPNSAVKKVSLRSVAELFNIVTHVDADNKEVLKVLLNFLLNFHEKDETGLKLRLLWSSCLNSKIFSKMFGQDYQIFLKNLSDSILANFDKREVALEKPSTLFKFKEILLLAETQPELATFYSNLVNSFPPNHLEEIQNYTNTNKLSSSYLQDEVGLTLRAMKLPYEKEKLLLNIYFADFLVPPNTVLEINGPTHYSLQDVGRLNGKFLMKERILMAKRFKVTRISYTDWYGVKGVTNRMNLLNTRLFS